MMEAFWRSFKAEGWKARNSWALWLSLLGTAANVLMFFGLHLLGEAAPGGFRASGWEQYIINHYEEVAFMMLPLYVIILCSLVFLMESRGEMWVQLFTLPFPRRAVYQGKLAFLLLLFVGAHLLFVLGMLLSGLIMGALRPASGLLAHGPSFVQLLELAGRTFLSVLGLFGLHAYLSLRFSYFIIPLLIGILGYVVTGLLGVDWAGQWLNPYAPTLLLMPQYTGEAELRSLAGLTAAEWMSPAYFFLFTVLAQRLLERRNWGG